MYKFKTIFTSVVLIVYTLTSCSHTYLDDVDVSNEGSIDITIDGISYSATKGISVETKEFKDNNGNLKIYDFLQSKSNLYFNMRTLLNTNEVGGELRFESKLNGPSSEIALNNEGHKYLSISGSVNFVSRTQIKLSGCKFYEFNSEKDDDGNIVRDSVFVDVEGVINYDSPEVENIDYCAVDNNDSSASWIESFLIDAGSRGDSIMNVSGNNDGYYDYSYYIYSLSQKYTFDMDLTPGHSGASSFVHWKVFVDLNSDGQFGDDEAIFATDVASQTKVSTPINVKDIENIGRYKMRVMMKVVTAADAVNDIKGCSDVSNGEVEDYTLNVSKRS